MRVLITGHIQTGSYTNKEGQKIYTTDVVIEDQEFADSKAGNAGIVPAAAVSPDGFMNLPEGVEDEGLPFNS